MTVKDDKVYLEHILECIRRIEEYTARDRDRFLSSKMVQDATLRNLQILSESTQRLSEDAKKTHPEIPWRSVSGFRNVLTHAYLGIDLEQVWRVIVKDIVDLKVVIENLVKS